MRSEKDLLLKNRAALLLPAVREHRRQCVPHAVSFLANIQDCSMVQSCPVKAEVVFFAHGLLKYGNKRHWKGMSPIKG